MVKNANYLCDGIVFTINNGKNLNRTLCVFVIMLLQIVPVHAQNLIPNGDFEKHNHFFSFRTLGELSTWYKPNHATPDFVYSGIIDKRFADNHCVGLHFWFKNNLYYSKYGNVEYVQVKLTNKPIANKLYCLTANLLLSPEREYAAPFLNFSLTKKAITAKKEIYMFENVNYYNLDYAKDSLMRDKKNWMYVCKTIQAKGNEKYFTIGYFDTSMQLTSIVKKNKSPFLAAYYYIDNISLTEITDSSTCDCKYTKQKEPELLNKKLDTLTMGSVLVLNNVYFANNKANILPQSEVALNELLKAMQENTNLVIEIIGYTDNVGNEEKNTILSENIANSIANFLIENKIEKFRVRIAGFGSVNPIGDNNTEEGRALNRRIEIKVLQK